MDPIFDTQAPELRELCRSFHVQRLEVFGSALRTDFDPMRSDLDFLVVFGPLPPGAYSHNYFGLMDALEQLFQRPVDLVVGPAIRNPYFRESIERSKALLYAA